MPKIVGIVDGSFLPIQRPANELDYAYICRRGFTAINAMAVCDNRMKFSVFFPHFPGSCHDSHVLQLRSF